jgi:hypothetical protein
VKICTFSSRVFGVVLSLTSGTSGAMAAGMTVPADLSSGDTYRLMYINSTLGTALSTDIADYNALVVGDAAGEAHLAALGTTWSAVVSTAAVDARDNTSTNKSIEVGGPIYGLDGLRLANDNADLRDISGILNRVTSAAGIAQIVTVYTGTLPHDYLTQFGRTARLAVIAAWTGGART